MTNDGMINDLFPYRLVQSNKEPHGWSFSDYQDHHKRECSQERLLLNPYAGCSLRCAMCYTQAMPGYFSDFWKNGIITVFQDFDKVIQKQLSRLKYVSCGYLSPVCDPFQRLEARYHLSENIIKVFTGLNAPIEFITKMGSNVPEAVFDAIATQAHSFVQFTTFTNDDVILRNISGEASTFEQQLDAIERARQHDIQHVVARIDPVIPFITDSEEMIEAICREVSNRGATHVVMSCMDIPVHCKQQILKRLNIEFLKSLYDASNGQMVGNDLNASIDYRRELFGMGKRLATKYNMTFALCMEFEAITSGSGVEYKGLNEEFMTSPACEGVEIPLYHRNSLSQKFSPLAGCNGNCLDFAKSKRSCKGICHSPAFQGARSLRLKDYRYLERLAMTGKLL